ncbi:hypothetical protein B0T25DRAFT_618078 [Lasiosphaeria hispida]|uniref:Nephrocystin 3-like N-terminal domain-containing protein n=1 Tax=Lasiosphaeria hispida TaxID=260671 RepID=A0AAJ0M7K3_9PEZI|nr:hypothetical protein B0T25DRAFT_618078 [Lasiosphaeria hispida]
MSAAAVKPKVYRFRNIPIGNDRHAVGQLLSECLHIPLHDIHITSLANAVDPWETFPTQTGTLTFSSRPDLEGKQSARADEWRVPVLGLRHDLILDAHFEGFTPLNKPDPAKYTHDCIAISGLASHPFGSWQPHGDDKSYMWIRDSLASSMPSFRFLTYGYDTTLINSQSFQIIPDLGGRFIQELRSNGWASPEAKRIVFLAHSLGGVLLKHALVMLANSGESETFMLERVRGAVFFGVPSKGMDVASLLDMTRNQPNQDLVRDLSVGSQYLTNLGGQFDGVSKTRQMKFYWVYETKKSPTVRGSDGKFAKTGAPAVLVSRDSATSGCHVTNPLTTFQIDDDHSDMVKFSYGDTRISVVKNSLIDIIRFSPVQPQRPAGLRSAAPSSSSPGGAGGGESAVDNRPLDVISVHPTIVESLMILRSLRAPERDRRLEQIDEAKAHSFQWVFDDMSIGFAKWLRAGTGIFWISGKPGSGKSTLMKHIYNNDRTLELITQWGSQSPQLITTFFFHHRGNAMQKSFEGLLRGVISQVLEKEPDLSAIIRQMLIHEYVDRVNRAKLGDFKSDMIRMFRENKLVYDEEAERGVETIMQSLDRKAQLSRVFFLPIRALSAGKQMHLERILLAQKSALLQAQRESDKALEAAIKDLCCTPDFPLTHTASTVQLTRSWLEAIDIRGRITALLLDHGFPRAPNSATDPIAYPLVSRQDKRDVILESIQHKTWTRKGLEGALLKLLGQEQMDLQLTLFLDALDEYDGNPEFIAAFLSSLVSSTNSHTRVRICFSSRPWDVFLQEFGDRPGFKIHEHTEGDIHAYCMDVASSHPPEAVAPLAGLLPEIVRRAQGVFLWVRLVLADLTEAAGDTERALQLGDILDSLPDELDGYYATIVNRIPQASRWDAYVLLECVSRAHSGLDVETAHRALELSRASGFKDAQKRARRALQLDHFLRKIAELSGGLVEAVWSGERPKPEPYLQFMHQTVKEFVGDPTFKHKILGDWAKVVHENGHVFLSKVYVLEAPGWASRSKSFWATTGYHAREAERTTGKSQFALLSEAPSSTFPHRDLLAPSLEYPLSWRPSALSFALFYGLNLHIDEAMTQDPSLASNTPDSAFSPLLGSLYQNDVAEERVLETARLITGHGCCPTMNDVAFMFDGTEPRSAQLEAIVLARGEALLTALRRDPDFPTGGSLLHLGFSRLIAHLVAEVGMHVDVNALDADGRTPIDVLIARTLPEASLKLHWQPKAPYLGCLLLVERGGMLRTTTPQEWGLWHGLWGLRTLRVTESGRTQAKTNDMPRWLHGSPDQRGKSTRVGRSGDGKNRKKKSWWCC